MQINDKLTEYLISKLYEDLEKKVIEVAKIDLYKTQLEELNKKLETLEKEVVVRGIKIQELEAEMLKSTIESVGSEVRRGRPKKEV